MKSIFLILIFLNLTTLISGQDSLNPRYSIYYPDGRKYTGKPRDFVQLNNAFEENGRVWMYTRAISNADLPTIVGFRLFTIVPLWICTVDSSEIKRVIKSVTLEELMKSDLDAELQKQIEKGTLTESFVLKTLGPPNDRVKYFDEKNYQVHQWTYSRLHLYLIFTNRVVSNYIKMENYK